MEMFAFGNNIVIIDAWTEYSLTNNIRNKYNNTDLRFQYIVFIQYILTLPFLIKTLNYECVVNTIQYNTTHEKEIAVTLSSQIVHKWY